MRFPGIFHVQLSTLAEHGDPWTEERIEQLVRELADIGVHLDPNERRWPRTPLEPLADHARRHQFLAVMERALDTLTGSPYTQASSVSCGGKTPSERRSCFGLR